MNRKTFLTSLLGLCGLSALGVSQKPKTLTFPKMVKANYSEELDKPIYAVWNKKCNCLKSLHVVEPGYEPTVNDFIDPMDSEEYVLKKTDYSDVCFNTNHYTRALDYCAKHKADWVLTSNQHLKAEKPGCILMRYASVPLEHKWW